MEREILKVRKGAPGMEIVNLMLAEYANTDSAGRLNIIGVFSGISAKEFPFKHKSMYLVVRFAVELGEYDNQRTLNIKLLDEDANQIAHFSTDFQIESQGTGQRSDFNFIIEFRDLEFQKPGRYEFRVFVDSDHKGYIPLDINKLEAS